MFSNLIGKRVTMWLKKANASCLSDIAVVTTKGFTVKSVPRVEQSTKLEVNDQVVNIREGSSRKGWSGYIKAITKVNGEPAFLVEWCLDKHNKDIFESQTYLVKFAHNNLKLIKEKQMNQSNSDKFVVLCFGGKAPTVRHPHYTAAKAEAERLASINPDKEFFVAELKSVSTVTKVTTRSL